MTENFTKTVAFCCEMCYTNKNGRITAEKRNFPMILTPL